MTAERDFRDLLGLRLHLPLPMLLDRGMHDARSEVQPARLDHGTHPGTSRLEFQRVAPDLLPATPAMTDRRALFAFIRGHLRSFALPLS